MVKVVEVWCALPAAEPVTCALWCDLASGLTDLYADPTVLCCVTACPPPPPPCVPLHTPTSTKHKQGADFGSQARKAIESKLRQGMNLQEIEWRLKHPGQVCGWLGLCVDIMCSSVEVGLVPEACVAVTGARPHLHLP